MIFERKQNKTTGFSTCCERKQRKPNGFFNVFERKHNKTIVLFQHVVSENTVKPLFFPRFRTKHNKKTNVFFK